MVSRQLVPVSQSDKMNQFYDFRKTRDVASSFVRLHPVARHSAKACRTRITPHQDGRHVPVLIKYARHQRLRKP